MASRIVTLTACKPFVTGEECPECRFDSIMAALTFWGDVPKFIWLCPRCRNEERNG